MNVKIKNLLRVLYSGWKESGHIYRKENVKRSRLSIYWDMIQCCRKYQTFCSQYSDNEMYNLSDTEKKCIGNRLKELNKKRDEWRVVYLENWKFLNKWCQIKWETTNPKRVKRTNAYIKHYGLGKGNWIQYGVTIICEHYSVGTLKVGEKVLFARDCDIDYTGDLTIGDKVALSEGVKILTHSHVVGSMVKDKGKECILTPLVIQDRVWVGARAVIMSGVGEIGRGAMISAYSFVRCKVPPYAIVMGNPAKVVGFKFTPEETVKFEEKNYPADQRIPVDVLKRNYEKYYHSQWKEINHWVKSLSLE